MSKYFISLGLMIGSMTNDLLGQTPSIQLDRPDQTECPFIVPAKYIQFESGLTYENVDALSKNYSYPTVLWKYGLTDKFEFRLITEYVTQKDGSSTQSGLSPVTVGFKTNICQEKGIIPTTSFIGHITTATVGSKSFQTKYIAPSFRFTMQHTLSPRLSLGYNIGAEWDGESAEQTYIYTLTTGISFTNKLGGYIELYGFAPRYNKAEHKFDCGLSYLINDNCMIDVSGGFGITKNAAKNYAALGFSYRFTTAKRKK